MERPDFPTANQIKIVPPPPYAFVRVKETSEFDLVAYNRKFNEEFPEFKERIFIMGENGVIAENLDPEKKAHLENLDDSKIAHTVVMYDEKSSLPYFDFKYALIKLAGKKDTLKEECPREWQSIHIINNLLRRESPSQYLHLIADHELGHVLCETGMPWHLIKKKDWKNICECYADAYATIRHFQTYGRDSPLPAQWSEYRTARAMAGDAGHWTSQAIEEVIKLNKQGAIENLTPHECRDLAVEIAQRTALTPDQIHHIKKHLDTNWLDDTSIKNAACLPQACGYIVKATKSPIVHELLERYLNILEKYDVFSAPQVSAARKKMAENPADTKESLRPVWKRLKDHWEQRNLNTSEIEHIKFAKKNKPPQP